MVSVSPSKLLSYHIILYILPLKDFLERFKRKKKNLEDKPEKKPLENT
jgi:hypothetical protein